MQLDRFFEFVVRLALDTDNRARAFANIMIDLHTKIKDPIPGFDPTRSQKMATDGIGATRSLNRYTDLLLEMMLARAIDNFLTYVSEMLGLIFKTRPETLRSSETVRLDAVLQHATMEDLISDLTDRKVNELSYQGMRDLSSYLDRLGFRLFPSVDDMERAIRLIEVRNIIVHNRRIVNRLFLSRVADSPCQLGELYKLDIMEVHGDLEFLARSASDIDRRAASKFTLPRPVDHAAEHARILALRSQDDSDKTEASAEGDSAVSL